MSRILLLISSLALLAAGPAHAAASLLLELRGEPAPGALVIGRTLPGTSVRLDDRSLEVTGDGWFVFGFGRDDQGPRTLHLLNGMKAEHHPLPLAAREWNIQRVEGVPAATVRPPESALARIRAEAALVRDARAIRSDRRDFLQSFIWPLSGPVTGVYGSQRFYNGEPRNPHFGVDIAAPQGTPVRAPADGRVTLAHPDMFYSGGTLLLDHGFGVSSTFIHLHRLLVREGEEVTQGQVIAEVGSTGRSTGPHLDWRINWFHERIDPQWFMGATGQARVESAHRLAGSTTP